MRTFLAFILSTTALCPQIAEAQGTTQTQSALSEEVTRLRAEVDALKADLRAIRGSLSATSGGGPAVAASGVPAVTTPSTLPPTLPETGPIRQAAADPVPAKPGNAPAPVQIAFKGAPEFRSADGWSFKPRGRLQIDASYLSAPASRATGQRDGRGFTSRLRRAYIGAQGTIPGGFGYRAEVDLAGNTVNWTDVFLTYDRGPFNVTIGQHHPFTSMEQLDSDLYLTFTERASFIQAFNLERRVGASAGYHAGNWMVNLGAFTDDVGSLTNDGDKSVSVDGRIVWMPRFGDTQLHLAASAHQRWLGDFQSTLGTQYRARPYIGTTDIRYVDTGLLTAERETHFGAEAALNHGRFHAAGEAARFAVDRPRGGDPVFWGGYGEVGVFLTDDTRAYRNGAFERVSPRRPVGSGGIGAIELNARYDRLDLTDAGIGGGTQNAFAASLIWTPIAYVRFTVDYGHLVYDIPSAQPTFTADVAGVRAQLDF